MIDYKKELKKTAKIFPLLKSACIEEEIFKNIEGFELTKSLKQNNGLILFFEKNTNKITIFVQPNSIILTKNLNNLVEEITINTNLILNDRTIEKRPQGLIYTKIQKQFSNSKTFNEIVLSDLIEQRYTLTTNKLYSLYKDFNTQKKSLENLLSVIKSAEEKKMLNNYIDLYTEFSTHRNYFFSSKNSPYKDKIYPTRTYLNSEDFSYLFNITGKDNLYKIYDLYNGKINNRNEQEILLINQNLLNEDAYYLRELKGLNYLEDSLVGKSEDLDTTYLRYLETFFDTAFGYKGAIALDRDTLLKGITHHMSGIEHAKRYIEKKLGLSYYDFEQLDIDEQNKLIKEKAKEKLINKNFLNDYLKEKLENLINKPKELLNSKILRKRLSGND